MSVSFALTCLELVVYLLLVAVSVAQWWRRRDDPSAWLLRTFGVLGAVILAGQLLPGHRGGGAVSVAVRAAVITLACFPYCLLRFATSFTGRRRRLEHAALAATAVVAAVTAGVARFPRAGEALPGWYRPYAAAFALLWTVVSSAAVALLWRAGTGQPPIARRRMRTLGAAAVPLIAGLLVTAAVGGGVSGAARTARQALGLASGVLFLLAFAPPRSLRALWRRGEDELRGVAETELLAAETAEAVGAIVLPQAATLAGARGGLLVGDDGRVLAGLRLDDDQVAAIVRELAAQSVRDRLVVTPHLVAVPVRSGWLAVPTSTAAPLFGPAESLVLRRLATLSGLALERTDLLARDAAARAAIADREAQLAEAQRTAQLGSYSWDLLDGSITWSDEMHRLLGFVPGEVRDFGTAFTSRIHPLDLTAVLAAWNTARTAPVASGLEYRIQLPDGTVRWIHGRVQPVLDGAGRAVRLIGTVQDVTERRQAEDAVAYQALHDSLTGLPNRDALVVRLRQALADRLEDGTALAVYFLDVDRFKWLNDSLGHAAGDELLLKVANRLRAAVRPRDTVARFGGDEFVVLCEGLADAAGAERLASRFAAAVARPLVVAGEETTVTVSIGIAYSSPAATTDTPETLLRDADAAMYRAKERGRDRCETFDVTTRVQAVARHETANALRRGMNQGQMVVHYQPEIDLTTGRVVGVEALVRWQHPERGLLGPAEFIHLAEETGLIVKLGAQVLHDACARVQAWQTDPDAEPIAVAVNLSARQLMAPDLCEVVESALAASGLDPELLCLEITESVLLEDAQASTRALHRLKALGVRIGVDDFGTGFSSLTYLRRFPVDVLKIDRSFVTGLGSEQMDRAIVASVVDLAHSFGLTTVAEGVETAQQLAELRSIGCEQGQGFLWSRPLPAEAAAAWIEDRAASPHLSTRHLALVPAPPGPGRHRVLIVEDDRSVRDLLRLVFEGDDRYEVVGDADDGRKAIALARHFAPDLILLDLAMPGMGGLEALPLIRAVAPDAKVAVLSGLDSVDVAETAVRQGAWAFFAKDGDPTRLLDLLQPLLAS